MERKKDNRLNGADIIIRPIITEKGMREAARGCFTFEVQRFSKKNQIRDAVGNLFKVDVLDVRTIIVKGRKKRVGRKRNVVRVGPWKKAIVCLASGQKIDLFEVVKDEQKT